MEFRLIDKKDLEATREKWQAEADDGDLFPNEVKDKLAWIDEALHPVADANFRQLAYGVFQPDSCIAIAVCDLLLTDRGALSGRWLKMLKVTLSPELDLALQEEDMVATTIAVSAYKQAVLGALSERMTHDADTLKLYGRTDEMLRFLMVLLATITQEPEIKLSASKQGRWLVIKSIG